MPKVSDFDIVFISYDEPNALENFQDLKSKFSNVKHVQNIKGFDAAHRAASEIAETDNFFVVDGDNKVVHEFFYEELPSNFNKNYVYSWPAKNIINGLIYGNGGIKLWPRSILRDSKGHELSNNNKGVDWCWTVPYYQMNDWFSYSFCNASSYQAFRSGFREGVKLSLQDGKQILYKIDHIAPSNLHRLIAWMTLGADIVNGTYAMFGSRLGFIKTTCEDFFDVSLISDYDGIKKYYYEELHYVENGDYWPHFEKMALDIKNIFDLTISNFNSEQSKTAKSLLINPPRQGLMKPELAAEEYMIANNFIEKAL